MVQVSTQAKYNDISPKDAGTLYWVVESKKIYLDGVAYGFNSSDLTATLLNALVDVNNTNKSVILTKSVTGGKIILSGDVKLADESANLLELTTNGGLLLHEDTVSEIADEMISTLVLNKLGQTNGIATLDATGKVPAAQLPSFVDDVLEFSSKTAFPAVGEAGKIYVAMDDNKVYRWGGSSYVEISSSLALGTTSSTAFRGDYGNLAYQHISKTDNPHGVTKAQVGLGSVPNIGKATAAQAIAGTSDEAIMTPIRVKEAVEQFAPDVTWTVVS